MGADGKAVALVDGEASGLQGGNWTLIVDEENS